MRFWQTFAFLILLPFFGYGEGHDGVNMHLKLAICENGIYKVCYEDLKNIGLISAPVASKEIALLGLPAGQIPPFNDASVRKGTLPIPIKMEDGGDGVFGGGDYFLFYGQSPNVLQYDEKDEQQPFSIRNHPYSLFQYYFVCLDSTRRRWMTKKRAIKEEPQQKLVSFPDFVRYKKELANPLERLDSWLGEAFTEKTPSHMVQFDLSEAVPDTTSCLHLNLASYGTQEMEYRLQDSLKFTVKGNDWHTTVVLPVERLVLNEVGFRFDLQVDTVMSIEICRKTMQLGMNAYLDDIQLSYERRLKLGTSTPLWFRSPLACGNVTEFEIHSSDSLVFIWQVDSVEKIRELPYDRHDTTLSVTVEASAFLQEFVAFTPKMLLVPRFCGLVQCQDIHAYIDKDYVVVTHPDFKEQAEALARWHEEMDGYRTLVITTQEVYDAFSSGVQDPSAIRLFMKNLYENASSIENRPKYLLLFGAVSYDYKNLLGTNSNFVPTLAPSAEEMRIEKRGWLGDDNFAYLEPDEGYQNDYFRGDMDIAVGRLPVRTVRQAEDMLEKIKVYGGLDYMRTTQNPMKEGNFGLWRNEITFVASKGFVGEAEREAYFSRAVSRFYQGVNMHKIYQNATDSLPQIQVTRKKITDCFNNGNLFVGYYGHATPEAWSEEHLLDVDDIRNWDTTKAKRL